VYPTDRQGLPSRSTGDPSTPERLRDSNSDRTDTGPSHDHPRRASIRVELPGHRFRFQRAQRNGPLDSVSSDA
jgi:hypothetical protein